MKDAFRVSLRPKRAHGDDLKVRNQRYDKGSIARLERSNGLALKVRFSLLDRY
jgi:hypothetical protein